VEGIYKVGKFDPEILQKAERIAVPLLATFCNRLPKAAVKPSKKDKEQPEEKKAPPASSAGRAPSGAKAGSSNKELHERIERLEDAYRRLEKRVERLAAKSS
jgi:molecular chaperone GrpE (heat shock protein)